MPTILCYGDSNTHGTPPMARLGMEARLDAATRWPGVLAAELAAEESGDWQVIEAGLGGRTTVHDDPIEGVFRNGLSVLPAVLHSHKPLDLVIIMLGTNDLKQRFDLTGLDVALGAERLVRCVQAELPGTRVLLVCPPPAYESGCLAEMFTGAAERAKTMPGHMARVAAANGAAFLDAGAHIACDPLDGVHFTAASHAVLGRAVAAAVRETLS